MKLYSIALPSDLIHATKIRFRRRLAEAVDQYVELSGSGTGSAFEDALTWATAVAADTPSMRAWIYTISQLAVEVTQQPVPHSSLVGHIHADGPAVGRLFELLGWEALGAAFNACGSASFEMPSAPPSLFPVGELGAFAVGEHWPTSGTWSLSTTDGVATLAGPRFTARSLASEPAWVSNVRLSGAGIDAYVPLSNPALMNRDFQEFPMVRSRTYAFAWAPVVVRAAEIISCYSEPAAACTQAFVRCVIPLVCGDSSLGSASREAALGLIFLPASDFLDQVTELLLHEAMHQYLFRIEECGDLFAADTDSSERFYSPWRSDPRPLRMTLHGAFVFAAVADLYLWRDASSVFKIDPSECAYRAYHRARQVRLALDIVHRNAKLTRFGGVVLSAIEHDVSSIFDRVKIGKDERASIEELLTAHSQSHVSYAR